MSPMILTLVTEGTENYPTTHSTQGLTVDLAQDFLGNKAEEEEEEQTVRGHLK